MSIRNFEEYGSTKPASLLQTISTKPMASNPRRGRISFQTSGQTAFSRSIWNFLSSGLEAGLNLLFDSI